MAKQDVLDLAQMLALDQLEPSILTNAYDELVLELAERPILTQATIILAQAGQPIYQLPDTAVKIFGMIFNGQSMDLIGSTPIEAVAGRGWQSVLGRPVVYLTDDLPMKQFRVYKTPTVNSVEAIFPFGSPMGDNYPTDAFVVLHTQALRDVPPWLDLFLALALVERVTAHDAVAADLELAAAAGQLAKMVQDGVLLQAY